MNQRTERPRRRRTVIGGAAVLAAATTLSIGGVLAFGGHHSSHSAAAPAGALKAQRAAVNTGDPCADFVNNDVSTGLTRPHDASTLDMPSCDTSEIAGGFVKPGTQVSNICVAVNQLFARGTGFNTVPTSFGLHCQDEEVKTDPSVNGNVGASSLCKGVQIASQDNSETPDPAFTAACSNVAPTSSTAPAPSTAPSSASTN